MLMHDRVIRYFKSKDLSKEIIPRELAEGGLGFILDSLHKADIIAINKDIEVESTFTNIKDLTKLQIPWENFFIEMSWQNLSYGLHVITKGKELNITVFMNQENDIIPLVFDLNLDRLPRFYVGCPSRCDKFNSTKPGLLGSVQCMRTPNNADLCVIGKTVMTSIMFLVDVINFINKKPEYVIVEATTPPPLTRSGRTNSKPSNRYIYINKSPILYVGQSKEKSKGNKKSPHERRGHYRYYKNGKVVWVKSSKVHGGKKEQKIYRI